jgi:uncharacterized protein (TIGR02246 family)
MKLPLCSVFFLLLFSVHSTQAQYGDVEAIQQLNMNWLNAYPKKDSAALSKVLADDFILITPNGTKENKKDNLLNLLSPNIEFISVVIDSTTVRLLTPDVGILTAWTSFTFKFAGKETKAKNCYQDVYMKRNNKWVAVQAHVSSLSGRR